MGIVNEFKEFNAELKNRFWSVSSISSKNELIVSLWWDDPFLIHNPTEEKYIYISNVERWSGLGNKEFRENLDKAADANLKIRAVATELKNKTDIEFIKQGKDASKYPKKFTARKDLIGVLTKWDGVNFEFEFSLDQ
ncbi:hypothetical protein [Acinetobacter guillouiae]|uniref:hypothetical protein n=1 Tax=Acinetobacter guillouiae TaxID=106649 RepID=UPI001CD69124|nr:hypothetical protein [Acinetobacter guillouiae]